MQTVDNNGALKWYYLKEQQNKMPSKQSCFEDNLVCFSPNENAILFTSGHYVFVELPEY